MFVLLSLYLLATVPHKIDAGPMPSEVTWLVTNWGAGCAHRGCFYDFIITAPASRSIPAFSAYCSGDEETANGFFRPCGVNDSGLGNRGVAAKFIPRKNPNIGSPLSYFAVSFAYTDISTGRHVTLIAVIFIASECMVKKQNSPGTVHNFTGYGDAVFNQFVGPARNFTITPTEYHAA
jgi:hypothetical protein